MSDRTFALKPFVNLEGDGDDSEGVMVDTHSATMCSCNQTAWWILQRLKSRVTVADLVGQLVADFDVDEQDAHRDVMNFIHQLASMDLVDESK
ncbi:MAG: PqqD family protein [Rhodospirillales bacterium]